jgi:hypothetical protein
MAEMLPASVASFAAALEELKARSIQVNEARLHLRRARNEVNVLRQTCRVQRQEVQTTLLQKVVEDRAACLKWLKDNLEALDDYILVVQRCDLKLSDWKKQLARAVVWPKGFGKCEIRQSVS